VERQGPDDHGRTSRGIEERRSGQEAKYTGGSAGFGDRAAEVIAIALPRQTVQSTLAAVGPLTGRVVQDATNPLANDLRVITPETGSGGEQIAEWTGGARVVKAFNTIGTRLFGNPAFDMFYCGDDASAKTTVRSLIEDTKMAPVDVGPLKNARYLEQMAGLWVDLAVQGRVQGAFGFKLVKAG
jgi:8-hydroxy-5-deazaflavin:NADPH oxidoreductase